MKYRKLEAAGEQTYALVFQPDDEVMKTLEDFAVESKLVSARLTAIGGFQRAKLGYYDVDAKEYVTEDFQEQLEVISFLGDITCDDEGSPTVHVHVVLGRRDFSAIAGHLMAGTVRPTLEVMLTESPVHLRRKFDQQTGLTLIAV